MHTYFVRICFCYKLIGEIMNTIQYRPETDILFETSYPDSDLEPFRTVANYFKQFEIDFELSILFIATESV